MDNVQRGDHVVIADLSRAFRRLADGVAIFDQFDRLGVHLHVCDLLGHAFDLSRLMRRPLIQILDVFADLERAFIAERSGEASRARRVKGEGVGRPPYGFKYEARYRRLPNGERRRYLKQVPDTHEREIMKLILSWRSQDPPWSWHQIYEKINYELKLRTTDGREWDMSRIRRACLAEAILQFQETRDGQLLEFKCPVGT
jgi:DNA invertase Pin-like site-specific DNA recombinase